MFKVHWIVPLMSYKTECESTEELKRALFFGIKLQVCTATAEPEGRSEDDLRFEMLLGSPVQDRFPSISVSVTLLSILIKYVSRPQACTAAKMETSNNSHGKTDQSLVSFFANFKIHSKWKL